MSPRKSAVAKAVAFATVLVGAASINEAHAQHRVPPTTMQNNDGPYAVVITTRHGDCAKAYHSRVTISGGHVTAVGDTPMEASGQINGRGRVDLAFGQVATATGRLSKGYGSGTWSLSTMGCTGSWRAHRLR